MRKPFFEFHAIANELWTADELLEWLEPGVFADLIDGEILMHSPVSLLHANLTNFLDRFLAAFIEHKGLGGIVHRDVVAVLGLEKRTAVEIAALTASAVGRGQISSRLSDDEIASRLDTPRQIVSKWRKRFAFARLPGLEEQPRGGRKPRFSPQSRRSD